MRLPHVGQAGRLNTFGGLPVIVAILSPTNKRKHKPQLWLWLSSRHSPPRSLCRRLASLALKSRTKASRRVPAEERLLERWKHGADALAPLQKENLPRS